MSENVKHICNGGECFCMYDPNCNPDVQTMAVVPQEDYDALLAERDALREAGKQINHHLERAKVFLDSERYATCGQEIAGAHALLAAWRAATGKDA